MKIQSYNSIIIFLLTGKSGKKKKKKNRRFNADLYLSSINIAA